MLIFHAGLPRSGKSYSACVDHIIPALLAGRHVFVCIAGVNFEKFADLTGLSIDEVKRLLHPLKPEDLNVQNLPKLRSRFSTGEVVTGDYGETVEVSLLQNSLLIIDEIQNIYPSENKKLPEYVMKFIAEHGHDGMDILVMSQSFKSVHKDWRVRVQRMYNFVKLTAVGMENSYKWEAFEATSPDKFQKISSGTRKYDPKYFGLYKSHTEGTENKGNLQDDRVNIFKTFGFKFGLPGFAIVLFFSMFYLYDFFNGSKKPVKDSNFTAPIHKPVPAVPVSKPVVVSSSKVDDPKEREKLDYFDSQASGRRLRLSGVVTSPTGSVAYIEVIDGGLVIDRFKSTALVSMGWDVRIRDYGVEISRQRVSYLATSFPRDHFGQVSQHSHAKMQLRK